VSSHVVLDCQHYRAAPSLAFSCSSYLSYTSNYFITITENMRFGVFCFSLLASASAFAPQGSTTRSSRFTVGPLQDAVSTNTGMTPEEHDIAMEKATKAMTAFTNKYLANTKTKLCTDKSVPSVVIKGLAEHKVNLGAPLCPCRFYDNKEEEAKDGYWNCPCVPMRERHECHCMLFLTEDNPFAGDESEISVEEVISGTSGLDM